MQTSEQIPTDEMTGVPMKPNGVPHPKVEDIREKTVDALHDGADAARVLGQRGKKIGRKAGQGLDSAAEFVDGYDVSRATSDVGSWMKKHPLPIMAAAAAVGFWFSRSLRR